MVALVCRSSGHHCADGYIVEQSIYDIETFTKAKSYNVFVTNKSFPSCNNKRKVFSQQGIYGYCVYYILAYIEEHRAMAN